MTKIIRTKIFLAMIKKNKGNIFRLVLNQIGWLGCSSFSVHLNPLALLLRVIAYDHIVTGHRILSSTLLSSLPG